MHTLRLNVNEELPDKFIKVELEIIPETVDFYKNQQCLVHELIDMLNGTAMFIELEEVEQRLENAIIKHENFIGDKKSHD